MAESKKTEEQREQDVFSLEDNFPDVTSLFNSYNVPPVSNTNVLIALDTNVLLLPYHSTPSSLSAISEVYRRLGREQRLFLPARVAREFTRLRDAKLADLVKSLNDRKSQAIKDFQLPQILEGAEGYQETQRLAKSFSKAQKDYINALSQLITSVRSWRGNDPVAKVYAEVFKQEVVIDIDLNTDGTKASLIAELDRRYRTKTPPGYKDGAKSDEGIGDLLIWKSLLKIGEAHKKDLAFVSGEKKADWVVRVSNESIYPRTELIDEYRRASGGHCLTILSLHELLEQMSMPAKVIEEVKTAETEVSQAEEHGRQQVPLFIGEAARLANIPDTQLRDISAAVLKGMQSFQPAPSVAAAIAMERQAQALLREKYPHLYEAIEKEVRLATLSSKEMETIRKRAIADHERAEHDDERAKE